MENVAKLLYWQNLLLKDFPCTTPVTLTQYSVIVSESACCIVDIARATADTPIFVLWMSDAEPRVDRVVRSYPELVIEIRREMRRRIRW